MYEQDSTCKSCGGSNLTTGEVGKNGYANIKPIDKIFTSGSPLLYTFCKDCGEVVSIKVKNTNKF